jgi:hypothetical protein
LRVAARRRLPIAFVPLGFDFQIPEEDDLLSLGKLLSALSFSPEAEDLVSQVFFLPIRLSQVPG